MKILEQIENIREVLDKIDADLQTIKTSLVSIVQCIVARSEREKAGK